MFREENAIQITELTKNYGSNKVLKNISLDVKKGEILGFLGLNGAGKSTTMNIITGCISPTEGNVCVCGYDVFNNPKATKEKIGYLPENPPLYFDMTVYEYLSFVYELKNVKLPREQHIADVMEKVQISHMADRLIKNLSKGYKQRTGIAQALIGDPEILILDEPTVGLDPKQIIEIRNLIKSLSPKHTVILSTHILQEVSAVCDSVAIISGGRIVAQNTISGLEKEATERAELHLTVCADASAVKDIIFSCSNVAQVSSVPSSEEGCVSFVIIQKENNDILKELSQKLLENKIEIRKLYTYAPSIEEIFIKYASMPDIDEVVTEEE